MLTSVACSCVRNGRRVSVPVAKLSLFSTVRNSTAGQASSRPRLPGLLAPPPRLLLSARSVSLSAASHGATDPPGAESDPPDRDSFGSFSADISSRRSFRKISPYMQDLRHREWDDDDGDEAPEKARRRPGRRNTPYWYFLQCKKLVKENKVSPFELLHHLSSHLLLSVCIDPVCPPTAAGGSGCVQQGHAAGREAAAGGVQLLCADRRLWTSRAAEAGLQALQ